MSVDDRPHTIFTGFLDELISIDKKWAVEVSKYTPYEVDSGIEYWELQEIIIEFSQALIPYQEQFDELHKEWENHKEYWGRYLGTAGIQYARNLIEDPDYEDIEFSMDWFGNFKEELD